MLNEKVKITFNGIDILVPERTYNRYLRILRALSDEWLDVSEIARLAGLETRSIGNMLGYLRSLGVVEKRYLRYKGSSRIKPMYKLRNKRCYGCEDPSDLYNIKLESVSKNGRRIEMIYTLCGRCKDLLVDYLEEIRNTYSCIFPVIKKYRENNKEVIE